jgi:hypothetical protein
MAAALHDVEGPIFDARDMAALRLIAFDHAGQEFVPESEYVKITKDNWALLSFALRQQQEMVKLLADAYYAKEADTKVGGG